MNATRLNKRRLVFDLQKDQFLEVKKRAQKAGVTFAAIIKGWIQNSLPTNIPVHINNSILPQQKPGLYRYEIYLDEKDYDQVILHASVSGLSVSSYMRLMVKYNLGLALTSANDNSLENLWLKGDIRSVIFQLLPNVERISKSQLVLLLKALNETGKFTQALDLISWMRNKFPNDEDLRGYTLLYLADIELHKARYSAVESLIPQIRTIALEQSNRYLAGKISLLEGELLLHRDDLVSAQRYFLRALEYFDVVNYPLETVETYLQLSSLKFLNLQHKDNPYLERAVQIVDRLGNTYYKAWYLGNFALQNYLDSNIKKAEDLIEESLRFYRKSGSEVKDSAYSLEIWGRICIVGDMEKAYTKLEVSDKYEKQFKPDGLYSRTSLLKLFVQSETNFTDSTNELKRIQTVVGNGGYPAFTSYISNTSKYLFGKTTAARDDGLKNLKQLSIEGPYGQVRRAAKNVLNSKNIQPVV